MESSAEEWMGDEEIDKIPFMKRKIRVDDRL